MLAGKSLFTTALVAVVALLASAGAASAGSVLEFSHGKEHVVQDPGTPPASLDDSIPAIAGAAQTGGAAPPEPPPTTEPPGPAPLPGTPPTGTPTPTGPLTPGQVGRGTVPGVLDQALAMGLINQSDHDAWRAVYDQALQARSSLAGQCRKQLRNVIKTLEGIAGNGTLTSSRMPALFLQLRRNTEFWTTHPRVANAQRVKFGSSELLFQHYSNQGLQLQPLGNFGKANGLYTQCLHPTKAKPCEREKLKTLLDELLTIKSVRARSTRGSTSSRSMAATRRG